MSSRVPSGFPMNASMIGRLRCRGVSTPVGQTALTQIQCGASPAARVFTSPMTPFFEAT